jgi:hypothetical protein
MPVSHEARVTIAHAAGTNQPWSRSYGALVLLQSMQVTTRVLPWQLMVVSGHGVVVRMAPWDLGVQAMRCIRSW